MILIKVWLWLKNKKIYFKKVIIVGFVKKLIDNDEDKVRDHCHVTGKFRGAAHKRYNLNFKLTRKVPVIFHILRGYGSHIIFNELDKFNVKIKVIPKWIRKMYGIFFK